MRGLPLARLGHLHRLSGGGARSPTGRRRPFPGKHHPASGPSHRHRSYRNHRRRGAAGSSPPLGYWPDEAREHAHSPQSRGSPDQSALPAINRSRATRPRPPPSLAGPSHLSPPLSKPRPRPLPALRPAPPPPLKPLGRGFSAKANRDSYKAPAPEFPRELEVCVNTKREAQGSGPAAGIKGTRVQARRSVLKNKEPEEGRKGEY